MLESNHSLPLQGRRVVITRPTEQAQALLTLINALGGEGVLLPLLHIEAVTDTQPLLQLASQLDCFNKIIFVSANAVHSMMALCKKHDFLWPDKVQVLTVGAATASVLNDYGISRVSYPKENFDSEHFLQLPETQDVVGQSILILKGQTGRTLIVDTLRQRGAQVIEHVCYVRYPQKVLSETDFLDVGLSNVDAWILTSSEAARTLPVVIPSAWAHLWQNIPCFVPHQRIADVLRCLGGQHIQITASGDKGITASLSDYFSELTKDPPTG